MAIAISSDLEAKLRARARAAGVTVETYIERIALDDKAAEEELTTLAADGLNSGDSFQADEGYWKAKRERLIERNQQTKDQ